MSARHTLDLLGEALRDLAPLVAAAVQALDKPGTRALRRKLDAQVHMVVHTYGSMLRSELDESEWDALRLTLPRYKRLTPAWPGRASYKARKAEAALQSEHVPEPPAPTFGLRLVVDNVTGTRRAPPIASPVPGGAA